MTVFDCGSCEGFKQGYHEALWWLVVGAAGWNFCAFLQRRERQLLINALLYTAFIAFEDRACARHRDATR